MFKFYKNKNPNKLKLLFKKTNKQWKLVLTVLQFHGFDK